MHDGKLTGDAMSADVTKSQPGPGGLASPLLNPLRGMLSSVADGERRALIAALTVEFVPGGGRSDPGEQVGKRLQQLEKEKATLEDELSLSKADLVRTQKQLEAEQSRAAELQKVSEKTRSRGQASDQELSVLEAKVIELNSAMHQSEVKNDQLALALQRAELHGGDTSKADALQDRALALQKDLERERIEREQQRNDKDGRISQLETQLKDALALQGGGEEKTLKALWERLGKSKPALVEGHLIPNVQSFERLVDAFQEFVRFVDDFDKGMGVFLGRYTKYHPSVKVPWEAYTKSDDLTTMVQRMLAPQGGRPVGPMKMRLRLTYSWIHAAMVGCDSAIESLGSELQAHLMGPVGAATDANRKIRDYVKADGHLLFAQHVTELRSRRLAETYGRG